jgi:RNA polymerase sigma-70 factor (ECF subfamily)
MRVNEGAWPQDLIQRAMAGEGCAFDALIQPLLERAFRLAMTVLNDREAAEDAVQEATLKAWKHLDRFRPDSPPGPWFLTIVANECRSIRRGRWWRVLKDSETIAHFGFPDPAERMDLQRVLDRLPAKDLQLLSLYYHLDLPIEQVAHVLGITPAATKTRLHRIRRAMRPALEVSEQR